MKNDLFNHIRAVLTLPYLPSTVCSPVTPYTSSYLAMTTRCLLVAHQWWGSVSDSKTQEEGTIIIIIASSKGSELYSSSCYYYKSLCGAPQLPLPTIPSFRSKESLLLVVSSYNDRHRGEKNASLVINLRK